MSRLDDKWAKAGGVVSRAQKQIEDKLDALIARETVIEKKTNDVFARQNAPIDEASAALDALDAKLNLLSNGGPTGPLPGSGNSQAPVPPPTPPAPVSESSGGILTGNRQNISPETHTRDSSGQVIER